MSKRGLVVLLGADLISVVGNRVSMVAVPWLVLQVTGSAAKMGLIAAAEMVPYILTGVLAAPLADRFGLRRTSIVTDAASALVMAAVVLATGGAFGVLVVLVALAGGLRGLSDRVKQVMVKPLAEAAGVQMIRVTSAYEGLTRTATLIGASVGGVLVAWLGPRGAITVDAVSFTACAIAVAVGVRLPRAAEPVERENYLRSLRGGFQYLRVDRLVLGLTVFTFAINIFAQATVAVFLPLWVAEVLGSATGLSLLFGGFAAGAIAGNLVFTMLGDRLPRYTLLVVGALVGGSPRLFALGLSDELALVVTISVLCGFGQAAINPVIGATWFERVPAELQTRVFGLAGGLSFLGIPLGGVLGGLAVTAVGLRPALLIAATGMLAVTLAPVALWLRRGDGSDERPVLSQAR